MRPPRLTVRERASEHETLLAIDEMQDVRRGYVLHALRTGEQMIVRSVGEAVIAVQRPPKLPGTAVALRAGDVLDVVGSVV